MNLAFLNAIAGGGKEIASGLGDYAQSVQHQQDVDKAQSDKNDAQQAQRDVEMSRLGYFRRPPGSTPPTPGPTPVTGATPLTTSLRRATGPQTEDDTPPVGTAPVMTALAGAARAPTKSITIGSDTYDQDLGRTPEGAAQRKSEAQTSTNMAAISTWVSGLSANDPRRAQYSQGVIQALAANPTSFSNWAEHAAGTANIDPNSDAGIQAAVNRHSQERNYDVKHPTSTPGWRVVQTDKGFMRLNTQTGQIVPVADPTGSGGNTVLQPKTTSAAGGTGAATAARIQASANEMRQADKRMRPFESDLQSGKVNISGTDQYLAGIAQNINPNQGAIGSAASVAAMNHLQKSNPRLAQYLRDAMTYAEGEQGVMQRPSDFRMRVSQFLSAARSGVQPGMVQPIQERRNSILDALPASGGGGPPKSSSGNPFADLIPKRH